MRPALDFLTFSPIVFRERPIINSNTVNIEQLSTYPEGSLGREYTRFLDKNVS